MKRLEPPTAVRLPAPWPTDTYAIRGGTIGTGLIAGLDWIDQQTHETRLALAHAITQGDDLEPGDMAALHQERLTWWLTLRRLAVAQPCDDGTLFDRAAA